MDWLISFSDAKHVLQRYCSIYKRSPMDIITASETHHRCYYEKNKISISYTGLEQVSNHMDV